jgi:hypothetical protein
MGNLTISISGFNFLMIIGSFKLPSKKKRSLTKISDLNNLLTVINNAGYENYR